MHPWLSALALTLVAAPTLGGPIAYLEASCAQSLAEGQFTTCDQAVTFEISVAGTSDIMGLRLSAPSTHCSSVVYAAVKTDPAVPVEAQTQPLRAFDRGPDVVASTGPLAANEAEVLSLGRGWAVGTHEIRIMALGVIEDCNVGQLQSWGVNVEQVIIPE